MRNPPMKAISLNPPYGTLIAAGLKRVETRSWHTSYRGPPAIHQTLGHGQRNEAAEGKEARAIVRVLWAYLDVEACSSAARQPASGGISATRAWAG
jgi:hypothetical protein